MAGIKLANGHVIGSPINPAAVLGEAAMVTEAVAEEKQRQGSLGLEGGELGIVALTVVAADAGRKTIRRSALQAEGIPFTTINSKTFVYTRDRVRIVELLRMTMPKPEELRSGDFMAAVRSQLPTKYADLTIDRCLNVVRMLDPAAIRVSNVMGSTYTFVHRSLVDPARDTILAAETVKPIVQLPQAPAVAPPATSEPAIADNGVTLAALAALLTQFNKTLADVAASNTRLATAVEAWGRQAEPPQATIEKVHDPVEIQIPRDLGVHTVQVPADAEVVRITIGSEELPDLQFPLPEPLTAIEREMAEAVMAGWSNREIASLLSLSISGTEQIISRLHCKFGTREANVISGHERRAMLIALLPFFSKELGL